MRDGGGARQSRHAIGRLRGVAVILGAAGLGLVGQAGLGGAAAWALPADTGSGSAFGVSAGVAGGAATVPPTPLATLGSSGSPDTATVTSLNVPGVLSGGAVTVSTSSANFGAATESITSSAHVAGAKVGLQPLGLNLASLVQTGDISSTCTSNAQGSSGSASVASLSLLGSPVTLPATIAPNTGLTSTQLGTLSGVATVTLNAQTVSNATGSTSITVDAVRVTLLQNLNGVGLNAGTVINLARSACTASGPDILPTGTTPTTPNQTPPGSPTPGGSTVPGPTVTDVTPTSGSPSGGDQVELVGSSLCNTLGVTFGGKPGTSLIVAPDCDSLTVDAPSGSGTVPVVVTTLGGSTTAPVEYTYTDPGYWQTATDGGVFSFGAAHFYGSTGNIKLNQPVVAMADTPDHGGYWLFAKDGGVFAFGDAPFLGSVPGVLGPQGRTLNGPIVAAEATNDGKGYRLFATDGGVFDFGDAAFTGSLPGLHIIPNKPITAAVSAPIGQGYLLVAGDGGVFAFGSASFNGSLGNEAASGIVSITANNNGSGYWVFGANGTVYPFGSVASYGNAASPTAPVVFGTTDTTNHGYWMFGSDGNVYALGDAPNLGNLLGTKLNEPIVGGIGF